jgi:hypothetical protein
MLVTSQSRLLVLVVRSLQQPLGVDSLHMEVNNHGEGEVGISLVLRE